MDYYDGFLVYCCDGGDEVVAVVPRVQIVAVSEIVLDGYIAFA